MTPRSLIRTGIALDLIVAVTVFGLELSNVLAFQLDESIQQFEPMPDNRFLMLLYKDADASPPVRIITNWQPPAK